MPVEMRKASKGNRQAASWSEKGRHDGADRGRAQARPSVLYWLPGRTAPTSSGIRMNGNRLRAEALFFEGNRQMAAGEIVAAETSYREALRLLPDFAETHANLALLLERSARRDEAEHHYRRAIAGDPGCAQTHLNFGALLADGKRFDEAESAYRRALELAPDWPAAWSNLGALQACRKQEAAAEASCRRAIALDAGHASAHFNLAYLLLRQGRYEEGWRCFERRDWYRQLEQRLSCPRWRGESLIGRSLLIGFEAGHGDMIQFCRYADVMKRAGAARVGVICHPALKRLFATLDGADEICGFDEEPSGPWDYWAPPLSLPLHCGTRLESIPARLPYLHADAERRRQWAVELGALASPAELRVGLVWKGNPRFENDADRSLPDLATLAPLGAIVGVRWFSLQKGAGEDEAARPPAGLPVVALGGRLRDFADTAAAIANLDLVIGVDTAVGHLAGAMARNCWLLLPDYKTDWRWLAGRGDSPWYPKVMRLFRQPRMGDWQSVVGEVAVALGALRASYPAAIDRLQYT